MSVFKGIHGLFYSEPNKGFGKLVGIVEEINKEKDELKEKVNELTLLMGKLSNKVDKEISEFTKDNKIIHHSTNKYGKIINHFSNYIFSNIEISLIIIDYTNKEFVYIINIGEGIVLNNENELDAIKEYLNQQKYIKSTTFNLYSIYPNDPNLFYNGKKLDKTFEYPLIIFDHLIENKDIFIISKFNDIINELNQNIIDFLILKSNYKSIDIKFDDYNDNESRWKQKSNGTFSDLYIKMNKLKENCVNNNIPFTSNTNF
jgi:hypothetical protein